MANIKAQYKRRTGWIRVLKMLQQQGASRVIMISNYTGISPATVQSVLRGLLEKGLITKVERGVYDITEVGSEKLTKEDL